jgi:hypothetical protein
MWPEVEWISDEDLKDKVLQVWEYALDNSPLTLEDLEEIPFTLFSLYTLGKRSEGLLYDP